MPYANYYACKIDDCEKQVRGKGMCATHLKRFNKHGDPNIIMPRGQFAKQPICAVDTCEAKHSALGFCQAHYKAFKAFCDKDRWPEKRSKISSTTQAKYIVAYAPDHPFATKQGRVLEHRLVMEEVLGRYLERHENVHHKNGNRTDNRPENLEVWSVVQPSGQRVEDKVNYAIEILELYAPDLLAKAVSRAC